MTAPLTPPDCDLTDFPSMFLDTRRLLASETWIEAAAHQRLGHVLVCLWAEAFHQRPAASLPDNDAVLARLAMCDGRTWAKLRPLALAGWVKCTDGRFYHHVVAEKALAAWLEKLAQRISSGAGNAKRWGTPFDPTPIEEAIVASARMLLAIDPASKAAAKALRGRSGRHPDGTGSGAGQDRKREGEGEKKDSTRGVGLPSEGSGYARDPADEPDPFAAAPSLRVVG